MYAGLFTIMVIITRSSMYYFCTMDRNFLRWPILYTRSSGMRIEKEKKKRNETRKGDEGNVCNYLLA